MTGELLLSATFHVTLNREGTWEVWEQGIPRSLASFAEREDACVYAREVTRDRLNARIYVNGQLLSDPSFPQAEPTHQTPRP